MKDREQPGWFDFSVMALSPVLIMGLVGSLAFFLLDVLYGGQYSERLHWTLFFFVLGAVLVARIAIVVDPGRAKLYALVLGGVVFLAMLRFVDFLPTSSLAAVGWLINLVIIVIVLWASNKLVWNCTFLDEHDPDPGRGTLAEVVVSPRPESARGALPSKTRVAAKHQLASFANVKASTSTPWRIDSGCANSSGRWLIPSRQGIKIIPVGQRRDIKSES
jgi:hypothetical protein